MLTIEQIANGINSRSKNFEIGKLQELRTKIKKLNRQPGEKIFWNNTIHDGYAFHYGGRKELQYNIGKIDKDYRHGVAFSLDRSQSLPDVKILYPKIERFNKYMSEFSEKYSDMMLWIRDENGYSQYKAGQINSNFFHQGVFIFFGKLQKENSFSYDEILNDFDRLLPLYEYVESENKVKPEIEKGTEFRFSPGCPIQKKATTGTKEAKDIEIDLRHRFILEKLYERLEKKYDKESVGTENKTVGGNRIDAVVKLKDELIYYEIKTASTARINIRESLSQLLEYSYWPRGKEASKLVIIGEASLDDEAEQYLITLREKFSIPIYYEKIKID
ncbi:MAG: hypothetical protein Q8M95_01955 [Candidatus Methanoperedens sp.]|nr:hypothetical protein [Candidatus Methanoperedens sp.]